MDKSKIIFIQVYGIIKKIVIKLKTIIIRNKLKKYTINVIILLKILRFCLKIKAQIIKIIFKILTGGGITTRKNNFLFHFRYL